MQGPANVNVPGFLGAGARPMHPNDYKLAPPPTNAYQTDLALAAAANKMTPMPMVSRTMSSVLACCCAEWPLLDHKLQTFSGTAVIFSS